MFSASNKVNHEPFSFSIKKFVYKSEDFRQLRSLKIANINFENRKLKAEI